MRWDDTPGDSWPAISDDDPVIDWIVAVAYWVFILAVAGVVVRLVVQAVTGR